MLMWLVWGDEGSSCLGTSRRYKRSSFSSVSAFSLHHLISLHSYFINMASIYHLNHPQNSFWHNLISGLEDHPFFAPRDAPGPHHAPPHHRGHPPFWGWGGPGNPGLWGWDNPAQNSDGATHSEASRTAEQNMEPTAGPSQSAEKHNAEKEQGSFDNEPDDNQRRHGHCGKGKHHRGRGGSPHGLGKGCGGRGRHGPDHHNRGCHGDPDAGPFSYPFAFPFGGPPRGRGPRHQGRHGGRGWHHGSSQPAGGPGFDFLRNLAAQFGISLNAPTPENVDFVPSVDIFDTPTNYIVHVSLPGAKKDDLSIDYDAEESVLRLAGVVYRPGISEDLHQALVMEERAREVGVFEREVRLGTRESPAAVSVDEITAKLEDGVLSVTLPKIVSDPEPKKTVVVEDGDVEMEKDAMHVDEGSSVTMTPEGSDSEEETKEYVKVPVQ